MRNLHVSQTLGWLKTKTDLKISDLDESSWVFLTFVLILQHKKLSKNCHENLLVFLVRGTDKTYF
jgi:hypothetical protein